MSEFGTPGVSVDGIPGGPPPIDEVSSSTTAFLGETFRGPTSGSVSVRSFGEFVRSFGPIRSPADALALSVDAFFKNGGRKATIVRLVGRDAQPANLSLQIEVGVRRQGSREDSETIGTSILKVEANGEGEWGREIRLRVVVESGKESLRSLSFRLEVGHLEGDRGPSSFVVDEEFPNLDLTEGGANFAPTRIGQVSRLVRAKLVDAEARMPDFVLGKENDELAEPLGVALRGGVDDPPEVLRYQEVLDRSSKEFEEASLLVLPGRSARPDGQRDPVIDAALSHCEESGKRVLLIDPPSGYELKGKREFDALKLPRSSYGLLYYPWLRVQNPGGDSEVDPDRVRWIEVAPSGFAAGMMAKFDRLRGVWKAPAGVEASLAGAVELQVDLGEEEQGRLTPLGVNCIRRFPSLGTVLWGARTLATSAEWRSLPARRMAILIERSLEEGTRWIGFEPNQPKLWLSLRRSIANFMTKLFRRGGFRGTNESEAFFVACGLGETMTQQDVEEGRVLVEIGFAPTRPREFVVLKMEWSTAAE